MMMISSASCPIDREVPSLSRDHHQHSHAMMDDVPEQASPSHQNYNDVDDDVDDDHDDDGMEEFSSSLDFSSGGRFPKWIALTVLNLVAWLATIGGVHRHRLDRPEKWALSATTLSVVFAALGVACYVLARSVFMGQLPEVALIGFVVILWAGSLPVIMNPGNSIAVGYTDYLNANLYFSSWLSFFAALWIAGDLAKELYGMDLVGIVASSSATVKNERRGKWYALIATSLIVMSSSVNVYRAFPCSADVLAKSPTCRQTKFAISAGVIGTMCSICATLYMAKGNFSRTADWCSSVVMVIIWSFGLGYITFGSGPGQNIGNLYFSTWMSFTLSILLAAESYREYLALREQQAALGSMDDPTDDPHDLDLMEEVSPNIEGTPAPARGPVPLQSSSLDDANLL